MAPGGRLTAGRLRKIADVAERYGRGVVHLSVRMSPEILYVKLADVDKVAAELAEVGQRIASCGRRVRVPTACGGCEYNPNGWTDTQALAVEVNNRYFGVDHFAKFKIAFSGCPIDCMRTREMDLGFQGMVEPELVEDKCTGCELCARACQDDALAMKDGLPERNWDNCISCGDCIKVCPFDAMVPRRVGHAVYAGGKHGKHPHVAYPIAAFVRDDMVFTVVERVMRWYQENGRKGERIGITIDRVGIDNLRAYLGEDDLGDCLLGPADVHKHKWRSLFYKGVASSFPAYGRLDHE
ncbi:MAG: 4Fe-4S binding protein [Firmicutes bacterium]|nr:4Fe-4S binding protein [Bacillota bacterium]